MAFTGEPFDSGLELVVLEGGGSGSRHYLSHSRVTLGRHDPSDEPTAGVVTFPEPTVSRVHAVLEWEQNERKYRLAHRSRTNPTIHNGSQVVDPVYLKVGDRVKLGHLVFELKVGDPANRPKGPEISRPVHTGLHLLVLNGPQAGDLHPLNYDRFLVGGDGSGPSPLLRIPLEQPSESIALLGYLHGAFWASPAGGESPAVLKASPGLVRVQRLTADTPVRLSSDNLLVLGGVALAPCTSERAGGMAAAVKSGRECHPLQSGLRLDTEDLWSLGEQHCIRGTEGSAKGSCLFIDPVTLAGPLVIARAQSHPMASLELTDPEAGQVEISFASGRVTLKNLSDQPVGHNWREVEPFEEALLMSGDNFRLGQSIFSYEQLGVQESVQHYGLAYDDQIMPLSRAVNLVGYSAHCEVRIQDRRLGPIHGQLEVREEGVFYRHKHLAIRASVNGQSALRGQDIKVEVGDRLNLAPGIEATLVEVGPR
ncbi:MAG: FHA domain-containing protein [Vulcanimicrobiota bacterium]